VKDRKWVNRGVEKFVAHVAIFHVVLERFMGLRTTAEPKVLKVSAGFFFFFILVIMGQLSTKLWYLTNKL
jgi:hypothetical protein